jgi:glycosyltransferase involved in cell wall biosynthesis
MPDISIHMIAYNHEFFIAKAIEGVLMQQTSYTYQLVIGEDCSTDGTRKICEVYAKKYPDKIKLLPAVQNYGMVKNFIRTLEACTGKYIALCEGDDYWSDKNKLQTQVDFLENNTSYSLCFHDTYSITGKKKSKSSNWDAPDTSDVNYLLSQRGYIATASVVFRNDNSVIQFLKNVGTPPYLDFFIYVAVAQYGLLKFFPKRMGVYRVHEGGVWSKLGFIKALEKTVQGYQILYNKLPDPQKDFLRIRYLTALEDYFLNTAATGNNTGFEKLNIKEMNIEPYMIEFIKQNCEMRKKVSHYVTAVSAKTLLYSFIYKIKNKV